MKAPTTSSSSSSSSSPSTAPMKEMQPDPKDLAEIASFACELADVARQAILPYWRCTGKQRSKMEIEHKLDPDRSAAQMESPVTIADRKAEQDMRALIETRYPQHGIVGEEFGSVRADTDTADWIWVLDPIDGTKAFITGRPQFGTLIACLYKGVPVVGVIDQCVLDERWLGILDGQQQQAAATTTTTLNGVPVRADPHCTSLSDAALMASSPAMFSPGVEKERFEKVSNACKFTTFGSDCYAYALVASGFGAHVVVEADLGLYDYCALVPVVQGAGGVMTDWTGARLTLQNHEACQGRVVACANQKLHAAALESLNPAASSRIARTLQSSISSLVRIETVAALAVGVSIGMLLSRQR